jgi:putative transposase
MRPTREQATNTSQTYMITSSTWGRRALFRNERWARLLIDTLYHYRDRAYLLHEFVIMPDHVHVLLTPKASLEKAVQFIKGGFSYRVKEELGSNMEIWQKGFSDHRIRDASDYRLHRVYIQQNPVRRNLCVRAEQYPYSSSHAGFDLDSAPQGLKPSSSEERSTARLEGAPFQSEALCDGTRQVVTSNRTTLASAPEGALVQSKFSSQRSEAATVPAKNKTA